MLTLLTNPAFYSALAAGSAAFIAYQVLRLNARNAVHAARPELVLTRWGYTYDYIREGTTGYVQTNHGTGVEIEPLKWRPVNYSGNVGKITCGLLRNIGQGRAIDVRVICDSYPETFRNYYSGYGSYSNALILGSGEFQKTDFEVILRWDNANLEKSEVRATTMNVIVNIQYFDVLGNRYTVSYNLLAARSGALITGGVRYAEHLVGARSVEIASKRQQRLEYKKLKRKITAGVK